VGARPWRWQVLPALDANSSGKAPVGGVQTGLGGTAGGGARLAPIVIGTSILGAAAALGAQL